MHQVPSAARQTDGSTFVSSHHLSASHAANQRKVQTDQRMVMAIDFQAKRRVLEMRRVELKERLREVDSSWNALALINLLPVETLSYIFSIHSESLLRNSLWASRDSEASRERFGVAHVCQHWREVALGTSELWSSVIFTTPEAAALTASRSSVAPLTVALVPDNRSSTKTLSHILSDHPHRLRSVEVADIIEGNHILSLLAVPMPRLEKLVLRGFRGPDEWMSVLPKPLMDHAAPVLKHLEIADIIIPQQSFLPLLPTLVHLHLELYGSLSNRPPVATFFQALQALPRLEVLVLRKYIPLDPVYPQTAADNPAKFPFLRTISIRDILHPIQLLLNVIQIPRASVEVELFNTSVDPGTHLQFGRSFVKSRCIEGQLALQGLTMKSVPYGRDAVAFEPVFHPMHGGPSDVDVALTVTFMRPHSRVLGELVPALGQYMELDTLRSLNIELPYPFSIAEWHIFEALPSLTDITLNYRAYIVAFCDALNEGKRISASGPTSPPTNDVPVFPSLRSLTFDWSSLVRKPAVRRLIANALNKRPEGYGIESLRLLYSGVDYSAHETEPKVFAASMPTVHVEWVECSYPAYDAPGNWYNYDMEGDVPEVEIDSEDMENIQ